MNNIAIILTVFNRKAKTLRCMSQIQEALDKQAIPFQLHVYLTDDGSTDGTADALAEQNYTFPLTILKGTGSLYWNGGMINSWNRFGRQRIHLRRLQLLKPNHAERRLCHP